MNIARLRVEQSSPTICGHVRDQFSVYLDGELSGRSMAALARHLEACTGCRREFAAWRTMQNALSTIGQAAAPENLHARLREALQTEREQNTHLTPASRWSLAWQTYIAPLALRAAGGLACAIVLLGSLSWLFAAPLAPVEANDDRMAHLTSPHYLYSEVPPQPIPTRNDAPILVDAQVDSRGFVYDFNIVTGPTDAATRLEIEKNLLASIFRPATVFGTPVNGHVILTYTGVSVRG